MRESIGGTWLISIVITFIALFAAFLAYAISYTKAFNAKNYIINLINSGTIYTLWQPAMFNIHKNTLRCFLFAYGKFFVVIILSLLFLYFTKNILEILGVTNTRLFIGVGGTKKLKTIKAEGNE